MAAPGVTAALAATTGPAVASGGSVVVVVDEWGFDAPSTKSAVAALGALAFGCGTSELAHILATQVMALKRPKTMRVELDGRLAAGVSATDAVNVGQMQSNISAATDPIWKSISGNAATVTRSPRAHNRAISGSVMTASPIHCGAITSERGPAMGVDNAVSGRRLFRQP